MLKTLKNIYQFSGDKKRLLLLSLAYSFLNGFFAIFEYACIYYGLCIILGNISFAAGLKKILFFLIISIVGRCIFTVKSSNGMTEVGFFMAAQKRIELGNLIKKLPLGSFNEESTGELTALLTTSLSEIEQGAPRALILIVGGYLHVLAMALIMSFYNIYLGIVILAAFILYSLAVSLQLKSTDKAAPMRQNAQNRLAATALAFFQGIRVSKAFLFKEADQGLAEAVKESKDKNINLTRKTIPGMILMQSVPVISQIAFLATVLWLYNKGSFQLAETLMFVIISFKTFAPLNVAGMTISALGLLDSSMNKVDAASAKKPMPEGDIAEVPHLEEGVDIKVKDLNFAYEEEPVLQDINLSFRPKSLNAVVGPSGSGKSTLCYLIPRFWQINDGAIYLNEHNIKDYSLNALLAPISIVFQKVYLFQDSILENIRFAKPEATREEVIEAAKKARCHEFISALPEGYDTVVGEAGATLSGGERQRIAFARAIIKDAPLIILDEATSAVDPENEAYMLEAIDELTRGKTVIMIAHRLKTVENSAQIAVLDRGRLVQCASHDELKNQPGVYRSFLTARKKSLEWKI